MLRCANQRVPVERPQFPCTKTVDVRLERLSESLCSFAMGASSNAESLLSKSTPPQIKRNPPQLPMGASIGEEIKMVNQYWVGATLGEGRFGKVKLCLDVTTGKQYAMKIYPKMALLRNKEFPTVSDPQQRIITGLDKAYQEICVMLKLKRGLESDRCQQKCLEYNKNESAATDSENTWWSRYDDGTSSEALKHHVVTLHEVLDRGGDREGKLYLIMTPAACAPLMKPLSQKKEDESTNSFEQESDGQDSEDLTNPYRLPSKIYLEPHLNGMKRYSLVFIKSFIRDAAISLKYCHSPQMRIAHRDVKPANMFITDSGRLVLGDFGVSQQMDESYKVTKTEGTYHFLAPECCSPGSKNNGKYTGHDGRPVDIWALGVSLYALIFGFLPFNSSNITDLFESICNGKYSIPSECCTYDTTASRPLEEIQEEPNVLNLLAKMLEVDPIKRITATAILEHEWVQSPTCAEGEMQQFAFDLRAQMETEIEDMRQRKHSKQY